MLRIKLLLISLLTVISLAGLAAQVNVHGTVTDVNGETQEGVNILVTAYFADSTVAFQSVETGPDGTYEVEVLTPPINMLAILQVSMVDCWGTVITQEFTIFNSTTGIQADFAYCQQIIFDSCMVYIVEEWNPGALNSLVAWTPVNVSVEYIWSTGETTQYVFPQTSGNYCVTVTFPWGCSAEACYQYVIDTTGFCFSYITSTPNSDGTYNLEIIAQGTPPFTYAWDNGQTTSTLNNVGPGTYCVSTVDADGCTYTACIFLNDPNFCEVWIYYDINGGLIAEGYGEKPLTYLWSTGETTQSIIPDSTGLYCVTVTDANQCSASSCFYNGIYNDSCYVYVTVLYTDSNTIALQAIGSSFADSILYVWNTGETGDIIYPQDPAANYCVTMTDSDGCVASGCFEPYNWCYAWVDLQYLDTTTAVLSVFTDPLYSWGGSNSSFFVWSIGDTGQVITVTESGEYCVTATLGADCVTEACVYVDFENLQYECSAWVIQYPDSNGLWVAEALAWGYGEFSYLWSTGDTTPVIQLSSPNEYVCVTATNTFGCVAEACVDTFFNPCKGYISLTYISTGEVILDAYGWNDPSMSAEYVWSTGESGHSITVTEEGTYCVTITSGGCVSETCVDVYFWNVDSCGVWILEELVPSGTLYTAEVWGVAPFTYLWSNGSTEQSQLLEFNTPQLCVTVTDALGCSSYACSFGGNGGEGISVISGFVFADSVGVHDVVEAYSLNSGGGVAVLVDSAQIYGNFYKFNPLPAGLYILKARITPGNAGFDEFMPTYHRESPSWESADPIAIPNWLTVTTDIWMIRIDTTNGPGGIGGVISDPSGIVAQGDVEFRGLAGLPGVTVLLRDVQGNPLNYTTTLEDGSFRFTNLPLGTYRISYDIPGLHSPDVWVTLTHDDPEKLQVSVVVTGLVAVDEPNPQELELYPNPAKENIKIKLPGDHSPYHMQIVDMQGRIVKTGSVQSEDGIMLIDVEQYSPGLYHVNLKGENAYYFGRFVKQE